MISETLNMFKGNASEGKVYLFYLLIAAFLFQLFFGGAGPTPTIKFQIGLFLSLALLAFAVWEGALTTLFARDKLVFLSLVALWLVPLVQIIPLPPALIGALPGQQLEQGVLNYIGLGASWRPLTTDIGATHFSIMALVAPTAVFLAALVVGNEQRKLLVRLIVLVAVVAAFVAFFQFVSAGQAFSFYNTAHKGFGIGFFANRNFQADFMVIAMLLASALLIRDAKSWQARAIGVTLIVILTFSAVMATFSRAGMAFFVVALAAVLLAVLGLRRVRLRPALTALAVVVAVGGVIASTTQFTRFLERLETAADDQRFEYAAASLPIIADYFPVGSGMGTFVQVYQKYETIDRLVPNYANHVHNDYLEILMEGGVLGGLALLVGLIALGRLIIGSLTRARRQSALLATAAAISTSFLLAHSILDYPLRSPALACVFALMVVLMLFGREAASVGAGGTVKPRPVS